MYICIPMPYSKPPGLQYAKLVKNEFFPRYFSWILISSAEQLYKTLLDGCFLHLRNNTGG